LPFHSVGAVLSCIKVFNFDKVQYMFFTVVACGFGIISKKSLPNPML